MFTSNQRVQRNLSKLRGWHENSQMQNCENCDGLSFI
jgi:hypothetical protein